MARDNKSKDLPENTAPKPAPLVTDKNPLWRDLYAVNPGATKPFKKGGGFSGTQIDPAWRLQRMTEVFGPVGLGWGYEIKERRVEAYDVEKYNAPSVRVHFAFVTLRVWYVLPTEEPVFPTDDKGNPNRREPPLNALWTGEQDGGTATGLAPDEMWKMSVTDALGKCMLQIGLAADVYLGRFDDSKYRDDAERAYASERAKAYLDDLKAKVPGFTTLPELRYITGSESHQALMRESAEADWKVNKETAEFISYHNRRLASLLQDEIHEKLKEITTLEEFDAAAGPWRHALQFCEDKKLKEKIGAEVKAFRESLEPQKAPEKPQEAPAKQEARTQAPKAQKPQDSLMGPLPVVELTKGNNGAPRWGKFTNDLCRVLESLPDDATESNIMAFMKEHEVNVSAMHEEGGDYVDYAKKVYAARDKALDTFQGEGA